MEETISVRRFRDFQHYKDRDPAWIKLYPKIIDKRENPDMVALPLPSRFLAIALLCLAARCDNAIPAAPQWIAVETSIPVSAVKRGLADLRAINFIADDASAKASDGGSESLSTRELQDSVSVEPYGSTSTGAQQLVEWFVDESRAADREPPRQVIGQVASQVKTLLGDGFTADQVCAGLRLLIDKGKHPSILPSLVYEAQAPAKSGLLRRFGRGVTTEESLAAVQRLAAEDGRKELSA